MNERRKLQEAAYFLDSMLRKVWDPDAFEFELSAFLSAGRSVLQYIHGRTAKGTPERAWYDAAMSAHPIMRFLKDERDTNIHASPLSTDQDVNIHDVKSGHLAEGASVLKYDVDGRVIDHTLPATTESQGGRVPTPSIVFRYTFRSWTGPEDVITLCRLYLTRLDSLVGEGIARGIIR